MTKWAVVATASALALTACGSKPAETASPSASSSAASFKACMVLDTGGVDDKSFNQSAWKGMQDAKAANSALDVSYVQSSGEADYEPNLTAQAQKGCKVVLAVGGLLTDAVAKVSKKFPDTNFAIIDSAVDAPNVYGITFKNEQSGFLAGYVAASVSKTGKIGTYGGIDVGPPVTGYMDGYAAGAKYYNQKKGKNVQVLGLNTFAGSFTDSGKGAAVTATLVNQGADVVFPVAGGTGGGTLTAAEGAGGKLAVIWVDFPGCTYYPQDCKYIVTSALKAIPEQVKDYVTKAAGGSVPTGTYVGTVDNGGAGIDSFNQWDSKVSADTKTELDQIKKDITAGTIKIPLRKAKG